MPASRWRAPAPAAAGRGPWPRRGCRAAGTGRGAGCHGRHRRRPRRRRQRRPDAAVFAAREGDLESAKLLLDAGADVNQTTEYGWTPLLTATNNRNYKLGALSARARRGREPRQQGRLDAAVPRHRQPQHRRRRLSGAEAGHGPPGVHQDPAGQGRGRQRAGEGKHAAAGRSSPTQWFLEAGATPFIRAAQSSDLELMKLLLAHGADPKIEDGP